MKRKQITEAEPNPMAAADEEDDEASTATILNPSSDICKALTDRYAKSKAPQHRHLIATAAAMRSILVEEGLPLTPAAYFAAAITAFQESDRSDADSITAVSSLLSMLLCVDSLVISQAKAKDAAFVLTDVLNSESGCGLGTGTVRSLIKCLGLLVLRVDLDDWSAVDLPLKTLLVYAVDKRPKVRKCAQECVEKIFKALHSSVVIKNGSKAVFDMYRLYIPMSEQLGADQSQPEHLGVLHMLNMLTVIIPDLSEKVRMKMMSEVYKLLGCSFWSCTRHILRLLEALVEHLKPEHLLSVSEDVFSALASYISTNNNPNDTIISASIVLKNGLKKLHDPQPRLLVKFLPPIFTSVAGFLNSDGDTSKHAEAILKELINTHITFMSTSHSCNYEKDTPERMSVMSICSVFDQMLGACDLPTETMLAVISVLFLSLGEFSYFLMKETFLKLSQKARALKAESPTTKHLEACIGTAVIAMGPEKVLSLVPISVNVDKGTCSNKMMLSILKKYVVGASLQYFIEHIAPLAKSVQSACKKVQKPSRLNDLQTCFYSLWDLLPAFCRYPTDTSKCFRDLSNMLIATLEENPSLHGIIANAVQELVNGTRILINGNQGADLPSSVNLNDCNMETRSLFFGRSKKTASRDIKALACSSLDLFRVLTDVFLDSPPQKRTSLKEAISCLALVLGSEKLNYFFVSLLEKCEYKDVLSDSSKPEAQIQEEEMVGGIDKITETKEGKNKRCLMMELASAFVEAADEDLVNIIFSVIKSYLSDTDGTCQSEAYYTLSRILEVHSWFCEARINDLMDLLFSVHIPVESEIMKNRFSCFHYLLVHILKRNDEDLDTKAFLILNEMIVTLKTKKESRKLAYNILLNISCTLKNTQSTAQESDLQRLLTMVMGYLSSSSPHIMSGAISALSLLIYNDAGYCIAVPNLIPSVLTLLQNKSIEVIKAALGFIKVLVSTLHSHDLIKFLAEILDGMLPWSSVSKYHFKSKVGIILEILIRKCGADAVGLVVPDKYKGFVRTIEEGRQKTRIPDGLANSDKTAESAASSVSNRGQKRALEDLSNKISRAPFYDNHKGKRRKQHRDISSTDKKPSGEARGDVPTSSGNPVRVHSRGRNMKRRDGDAMPNRRNKMVKGERNNKSKKNLQDASAASKSGALSKSNKVRRKLGRLGPK